HNPLRESGRRALRDADVEQRRCQRRVELVSDQPHEVAVLSRFVPHSTTLHPLALALALTLALAAERLDAAADDLAGRPPPYQTQIAGQPDQLRGRPQPQLAMNAIKVGVDRLSRDTELTRDLPGQETIGRQPEHLAFTQREDRERVERPLAPRFVAAEERRQAGSHVAIVAH